MSSTSNVQAYLTSVFRPVYTYTPATSNFTTQLDISNVNTVTANTLVAFRADISDSNSNVFVGTGAGVNFLNLQSSFSNTAFGFNAGGQISNSCNVITIGYAAGQNISNSSNSLLLGNNLGGNTNALTNSIWIDPLGGGGAGVASSNTIAIGAGTEILGSCNIWIGTGGGESNAGSNNITLGHSMFPATLPTSYYMQMGWASNIVIAADLSQNAVAIGKGDATMTFLDGNGRVPNLVLDVSGSGRFGGGLALGMDPGQFTLDVNGTFRSDDGYGLISYQTDVAGNPRFRSSGFIQAKRGSCSLEGTSAAAGTPFRAGEPTSFVIAMCTGVTLIAVADDAGIFFWSGSGAVVTLSGNSLSHIDVSAPPNITSSLTNTVFTVSFFPLAQPGLYEPGTGI
jgi:hypothetical protein